MTPCIVLSMVGTGLLKSEITSVNWPASRRFIAFYFRHTGAVIWYIYTSDYYVLLAGGLPCHCEMLFFILGNSPQYEIKLA